MPERSWWGEFEVPKGATYRWQIGPATLWIQRTSGDWRISRMSSDDPLESRLDIARAADGPHNNPEVTRFAVRDDSDTVRLLPAHADRPVIVNTETPFYLPPSEEATLFIGTPLWVHVSVGRRFVQLEEFPLFRPSDTWFGPNTLTGTLCYASRTAARLNLENLPLRPHRAVSAVRIRNKAKSKLLVEKLKLPVRHLSIFSSAEGHLWTEALTLEREEDTEHATVRLDKQPSRSVGGTTLVATPREKLSKSFLLEAFGGIFAKKSETKDERDARTPQAPGSPDGGTPV